ncbi:hypothetical protein HPB48_006956 [Haemaphysalis longicornis]|uniref:Uncharacterized protein n=1 Tax=Haemaphysalis longicornis TaxID=44386 RepID=A0A9J6GRW4_HAELO|nr:hypothetical protein HPB48_006956 [Haemaphysalis longicornis]
MRRRTGERTKAAVPRQRASRLELDGEQLGAKIEVLRAIAPWDDVQVRVTKPVTRRRTKGDHTAQRTALAERADFQDNAIFTDAAWDPDTFRGAVAAVRGQQRDAQAFQYCQEQPVRKGSSRVAGDEHSRPPGPGGPDTPPVSINARTQQQPPHNRSASGDRLSDAVPENLAFFSPSRFSVRQVANGGALTRNKGAACAASCLRCVTRCVAAPERATTSLLEPARQRRIFKRLSDAPRLAWRAAGLSR